MGRLKNRLISKVLTRVPSLATALFDNGGREIPGVSLSGIPWTPLKRPLKECRLALVTTAGVHLKTQPPFDMKDPDGDPTFRELPSSAHPDALTITHDYYDHADAKRDVNIVYPVDRVRELVNEGVVGSATEFNLGFMGHIDGHHVRRLVEETAPLAAERLLELGADIALMTPG